MKVDIERLKNNGSYFIEMIGKLKPSDRSLVRSLLHNYTTALEQRKRIVGKLYGCRMEQSKDRNLQNQMRSSRVRIEEIFSKIQN